MQHIITQEGNCKHYHLLKDEFDIDGSDYLRLQGICRAAKNISEFRIFYVNEEFERDVNHIIIIPQCLRLTPQLKSRHFYKILIDSKYETPISTFRMKSKYGMTEQDICKSRKLIVQTSIDAKSREFQFKILNNILPLNYKLNKMKLIPSPYCSFGCSQNETVEHVMWTCQFTQVFWSELTAFLSYIDLSFLNERSVITGFTDVHKNKVLLNKILLIAKTCIYTNRCIGTLPCISLFKTLLLKSYKEEFYIAKRQGKLTIHALKWEPLMNFIILYSSKENN